MQLHMTWMRHSHRQPLTGQQRSVGQPASASSAFSTIGQSHPSKAIPRWHPRSNAWPPVAREGGGVAQVEQHLGLPPLGGPEAAEAHAARVLALYSAALPLADGLDARDRGPGDALVAVAADALLAPHLRDPPHPLPATLRAMLQVLPPASPNALAAVE